MKNKMSLVISSLLVLMTSLVSCNKTNKQKAELCSYDSIYDGWSKEIHPKVASNEINRASYGYRFNSAQGYNNWYFLDQNKDNLLSENNIWVSKGGSSLNNDGVIDTASNESVIMLYKASIPSVYSFCATIKANDSKSSGGTLKVLVNGQQVYPTNGVLTIDSGDTIGKYIEVDSIMLSANQTIEFVITGNVYCNPSIAPKNNMEESLYDSHTDWGYYGDIHCFYYNDVLHMYHLRDLGGNKYVWYMQDTTDMFRYKNVGIDDSFVHDHYMSYGRSPNVFTEDYIDSRDRTYFYDEQVQKYRSIGLCYKEKGSNTNVDLALRTSDDKMGFEWNQKSVALRSFPTTSDGECECSQLFRWNDRWYLCTGISGQSQHGVGGLSYWIGDKGKTIDEVDWQSKETHMLDGEDLCVPQIEKVKDRYYMFGWMPQNYNGNRWGGYKNLSREVYQLEDGTLASRIDEKASELLNKGRLFDFDASCVSNSNNSIFEDGKINFTSGGAFSINKKVGSSFNKFKIHFGSANEFAYTLTTQDNVVIKVILKHEFGKTYAICNDNYAFQSVKLLISEHELNDVECKLISEKSILEFDVAGIKVMSARTRSNYMDYLPGFEMNGTGYISDISFNRLSQYYDIYY